MADFHVLAGAGTTPVYPTVRKIHVADLMAALRLGIDDFWRKPSHYLFLGLIYPVVGVVLAMWTSGQNALPLIYPLMSGFALVGPLAAIGLYEISRRQEKGLDTSWSHAFDVLRSPALPSIIALGVMLFAIFYLWLTTAEALYQSIYGISAPASLTDFVSDVLSTQRGWTLIILGNLIGLVFALVTLCTTVIAFPLLLDRDVGAMVAIQTSVKAVMMNPVPMLLWGVIVALALLIGSIPFLVGLALVVPILGHATWHLYRKVVAPIGE
ncbi:MAG TPA: DUF2189 domain-containing protein [Devosiaceae bacterium]|jgi:uncharacterized membrane protein